MLVHSDTLNETRRVIDKLQRDFDTVLQITVSQQDVYITPASSGLNLTTSSVVAFERERFTKNDLQTALEAAMSKNYRGKFKFQRQLYRRLIDLRDTVKSIISR